MKHYSSRIKDEKTTRSVIWELMNNGIPFLCSWVGTQRGTIDLLADNNDSYEVTVRIEHRQKLNVIIHQAIHNPEDQKVNIQAI